MKIKRYTANSMRAALAQVRAEQGVDAVILSSRRGEDGIEVIAAVDYDEALFIDANRPRLAPSTVVAEPLVAAATSAPLLPIARTAPPVTPKALPQAAMPSVVATKMLAPRVVAPKIVAPKIVAPKVA